MKMNQELALKYSARMARMDDLSSLHLLEQKISLHYRGVPGFSLDRLRNEYLYPGFDITKSVHLVEDQRGDLVGTAKVWERFNPPVHTFVRFSVDPDLENRGLEDYLLAWAEESTSIFIPSRSRTQGLRAFVLRSRCGIIPKGKTCSRNEINPAELHDADRNGRTA